MKRIMLYLTDADYKLIRSAAGAKGVSMNKFLVKTGSTHARHVLGESGAKRVVDANGKKG